MSMKTLLLFIFSIGLILQSFGQTVTFDDYKKRADACLSKQDYSCAKDNYERALRIRSGDTYCINQLKKTNDAIKKAAQKTPKKTPTNDQKRDERESENVRIAEQRKKEGDELFKKGEYEEALKKYEACLSIPAFSQSAYAKERILLSRQAAAFQKDAESAFRRGDGAEGVANLKKILVLNSDDANTRQKIADYKRQQGDQYYAARQFEEAKKSYEEAVTYADSRTVGIVSGLIKNAEKEIKAETDKKTEAAKVVKQEPKVIQKEPVETTKSTEKKPNEPAKTEIAKQEPVKKETKSLPEIKQTPASGKRLVPKIITGAIGLGAVGYAYVLNSQYQNKLENYYSFSEPSEYKLRKIAYEEVKEAQSKNGLYKACLGVAAGAVIVETLLFLKKPKEKQSALKLHSSSQSWGLALHYSF